MNFINVLKVMIITVIVLLGSIWLIAPPHHGYCIEASYKHADTKQVARSFYKTKEEALQDLQGMIRTDTESISFSSCWN